ncbi:MAG: endonuclease III domain-containing protein [Actinomycetota bacterium]
MLRRLRARFGPLDPPKVRDPLEELILTVLSQNTSDVNRDRAFASLRQRFPTWEDVAAAPTTRIASAIKPGGLSNVKAPRIKAILREIEERQGSLDLSWMHDAGDEEVTAYLSDLPGVGPKTVACVLAFSLERPALPVDTHVYRVAERLGFYPARTSTAAAHTILAAAVPARDRVAFHVGLIRLGREICRPGRPRCEICPLQDLCPSAVRFLGA